MSFEVELRTVVSVFDKASGVCYSVKDIKLNSG